MKKLHAIAITSPKDIGTVRNILNLADTSCVGSQIFCTSLEKALIHIRDNGITPNVIIIDHTLIDDEELFEQLKIVAKNSGEGMVYFASLSKQKEDVGMSYTVPSEEFKILIENFHLSGHVPTSSELK